MKTSRILPILSLLVACLWATPMPLFGQDSTGVVEEETPDLIKSRLGLTVQQLPDGTIELEALLRARIDDAYQKIARSEIQFFALDGEGNESSLGKATTSESGIAMIQATSGQLQALEDGSYSFLARFPGNEILEESEADILVAPARLVLETSTADSVYVINLKAEAITPDGPQPIAEAAVVLYVKRMFSPLKIAEGETDADGMLQLEVPSTLPGDQNGNLFLTAKVEDTDLYGNLVATTTQAWGKPVSYDVSELPRALWSPNPPAWMIITFFILMGTVWIHYLIIVWNLVKVKSDRKE